MFFNAYTFNRRYNLKFEELKSSLKETVYPIYLLEGEEVFFRERSEEMIKAAAITEPQLNFATFDTVNLKQGPDLLVNLLSSCPFMSERRMITVREWYPTAQDLKAKAIKNYLDNPYDTAVLVIDNSKKCDALKKCPKVTLVDCQKGSLELITKYIRSKCSKENLIISTSTCKLICEFCLYDMTRINSEVEKLVAYKSGQTDISDEDVNNMVTKTSDYKIYEMVSFIADKKYANAYKILEELNSIGDKQMLFASLYYHFRRMFFVSMSNASDGELANILGVKEFAVTMSRRQAKSFTSKRLKKIMDKLSECERGFKSGAVTFDGAFLNGVFNVLCEN